MHISLRTFWLPKRGNTSEEYEDAFWPLEPVNLDSERFRFAIADGATESSFAGSWARLLVRAYCRDQLSEKKIRKQLPRLQKEWYSAIGSVSLPWYAEEKLTQGAFATMLGLTLCDGRSSSELAWDSTAIGDSCLFQVRGGEIITSFPIERSDQFNNHPMLMSSNSSNWNGELSHVAHARGAWEPTDVFYLMTDAIAGWFLKSVENGERPSTLLDQFHADGEFEQWIDSLRESGSMRNDDVTVLRISSGGD
jgi:hypothetical protein